MECNGDQCRAAREINLLIFRASIIALLEMLSSNVKKQTKKKKLNRNTAISQLCFISVSKNIASVFRKTVMEPSLLAPLKVKNKSIASMTLAAAVLLL